jgi:hypothetical protein
VKIRSRLSEGSWEKAQERHTLARRGLRAWEDPEEAEKAQEGIGRLQRM